MSNDVRERALQKLLELHSDSTKFNDQDVVLGSILILFCVTDLFANHQVKHFIPYRIGRLQRLCLRISVILSPMVFELYIHGFLKKYKIYQNLITIHIEII